MLTKPEYGWTDFSLEGTAVYQLSYLDDIAFEWLEQAIHGLETMLPFCVKGFCEPGRLLCTVSYWNCHIVLENDERVPRADVINELSHTSMLEFCGFLYDDISGCAGEWAAFADYQEGDMEEKRRRLAEMLARLRRLIAKNRERWDEGRCFL